uniref:ABC transporter ATP-binding protein n=1 Tax=Agathobacter sp. TaxID=2021311 RepID=UPI004056A54C
MLEIKELVKSYGTGKNLHQVLRGVNFMVHKGEFVAVMGPSGSGKTTLLDCISRYKPFESGEILLNGKDLGKLNEKELAKIRNEKIGFVFQDFMLLDGLTVFENICVPQVIKSENYKQMEKKAANLLKMFHIEKIGQKYPAEISGGQKQRTAVARALINEPLMILADEPTGNLDSRSSEAVIEAFITAKKQLGATILMVTHDSLSASYCDRVIIMRDGVVCVELVNKGDRREFFNELMDVLRRLNGGESYDPE